MIRSATILMLAFILSACASSQSSLNSKSRYDSIIKQKSYVTMRFQMEEDDLLGKTKAEVKNLLGEPMRVRKGDNVYKNESWIYYPQGTKNYIGIIIVFEDEKVKKCSYESVI